MNEPNESRTALTAEAAAAEFESLRPRLLGVAYGLVGTLPEAEDAVQEAWIRLQRSDLAEIDDLTGWLLTTTSRIALDVLRSARNRREAYIGPWLPEPVETAPDPADSVSLADSMSWAMLVVLETLTPAERASFVLHDVFGLTFEEVGGALGRTPASCRKLASRARAHVEARKPRFDVDPAAHRAVVKAFSTATRSGDLDGLVGLLDPDAVLVSDGGGLVTAARNPIHGADKIARFLVGSARKSPESWHQPIYINGSPGLITVMGGLVDGVISLGIENGRITKVDIVRNPDKFHGLRTASAG
ncbi:sigma-70 family RNA polymerase sigma factor [Glycomyces buryatensis]|uniref:Sigma-70 family RNA polymerase sigma factor n=1 Tax=Glycomyces buryatensis TaxID=2570927 RepID=A0A4S8QEE3_9ACTN|nr:sigma-70 family RNA polymerase sigma factor [Glycomyces buryatensis]THV41462.1 sigma-70 family RNA polymerase sigma factor [Glycomyces buryatensis]